MPRFLVAVGVSAAVAFVLGSGAATAAMPRRPELPAIKLSAGNVVPACVTPDRMMSHLGNRNGALDPKYRAIAADYKKHGEALRIRWDWAFYQMLHETNYLKFRRGDGTPGDVNQRQNNFAGLGATGNGVQGDSFADVSTGVRAHLQHLVAYSGETVPDALAKRTRAYQDVIISQSRRLGRPVRYDDLTKRWAADASYAASMESIGGRYRDEFCSGNSPAQTTAKPSPNVAPEAQHRSLSIRPQQRTSERAPARVAAAARDVGSIVRTVPAAAERQPITAASPPAKTAGSAAVTATVAAIAAPIAPATSALGATTTVAPTRGMIGAQVVAAPVAVPASVPVTKVCRVMMASFGGTAAVLIRSETETAITMTALEVEATQDTAQAQRYMDVHAKGGAIIGRFKTRGDAVETGYKRCDSDKP
ncbi:MAG: hypothetical protein ABL898_13565 [Hyphomicrobiaceae bacterium]|nr:glucosaminidase domain-containing protein [Hyphomicrobiaceae bacterium]